MSTPIYSQSFSVVKRNTGAFRTDDYWSSTAYESSGTSGPDSDYPAIGSTENNQVSAALGPHGENVLNDDSTTALSTGDHWASGGLVAFNFDTEEQRPSSPWTGVHYTDATPNSANAFDASRCRASVDYHFTSEAWSVYNAFYYPGLRIESMSHLLLAVSFSFDSGDNVGGFRSGFQINVQYRTWSGSVDAYVWADGSLGVAAGARVFPIADFENQWHTLSIEWQGGTVVGAWDDVLADGFVRIYLTPVDATKVLIYDSGPIAIYLSQWFETDHHQADAIVCGFNGQFGYLTNILLEPLAAEVVPAEVIFVNDRIPGLTHIEIGWSGRGVSTPATTPQTLAVATGSGAGTYLPGTVVPIVAAAPATGDAFYRWTGPGVAAPDSASTTITIPAGPTTVTATYRTVVPPVSTDADYYVATTGSDAADGSLATPFRTIQHALAVLAGGQTLFLRAGTYDEILINAVPSGSSWAAPTRIAAYPGETVWLKPTVGGASDAAGSIIYFSRGQRYIEFTGINLDGTLLSGGTLVFFDNRVGATAPDHVRVQDAEIINGSGPGGGGAAVAVGGSFHEFLHLVVHGTAGPYAFYISGDDTLVDHCEVSDTALAGIQIYHGGGNPSRNIVRNCRIHDLTESWFFGAPDARLYGIIVVGTDNEVYNNLIYDLSFPYQGGNAGINLYTSSGTKVFNNTVYGNTTDGIYVGSNAVDAIIRNNVVYGSTGTDLVDNGVRTIKDHNVVGVDPLVVNAGTGDFHLQAGSPARAFGVDLSSTEPAVATDFEDVTRSAWDAGAIEYP